VRFIGVAILWVPIASARVVRSTVLRGGGGASSTLIAPAALAGAAIGVLDHGGEPRRLASSLLAFAIVRLCFAQFYFENRQSVLGSRVSLRPAPTRKTAIMASARIVNGH
jgi:hypothetical protein